MKNSEQQILDDLAAARNYYSDGKFPQAIEIYSRLAELLKDDKENSAVIQIELGWSYYQNQDYTRVIECLQEARESGTMDQQQEFDCYRLSGFSLELLGQRKEAVAQLKKAVEMEVPETMKRYSYFELGKILFTDGQMMEAQHYFNLVEPLFTNEEKSYQTALAYYQGFTNYFQKDYTAARKNFDYVVQHSDDHKTKASGYFGMANLYYQQKDYPVLIDICEKIIRLDEAFFDKETLGYFLCESYLHLKNWESLEFFFAELKGQYPEGRYHKEYSKFTEALKHRQVQEKGK
jgi:tetratricopeptide (TPR) repeat protein